MLEVDEKTPLSWPVGWVVSRSDSFGGDVRVRIMCHGGEVPIEGAPEEHAFTPDRIGSLPYNLDANNTSSNGGMGEVLCKELLYLTTVEKLARGTGR